MNDLPLFLPCAAGVEDLLPGEDLMVRFGNGPKGLVVAEVQLI